MMNKNEVIILQTRQNKIYSYQTFNHQFMFEQADQSQVYGFCDTFYIAVRQKGRYNDNRMKITYYQYPLLKGIKCIALYQSKNNQWTYDMQIVKGNCHSMFIWFRRKHDQEIQLRTFDLRDDPKGVYQAYRIRNNLGEMYNLSRVQICINNAYQIRKKQVCLICISNKTEARAVNKEGLVNNNFIYNLQTNSIKQSRIFFQAIYNHYLIDYINLGAYCMFRTYSFTQQQSNSSPVFYINNDLQQSIYKQSWKCTYKTKYFIPGYSDHTLIQSQYQNANVSEFVIKQKKILSPKAPIIKKITKMGEDFDKNLIYDILELLQKRNQG